MAGQVDTLTSPFVVQIDGREKLPYRFEGLKADAAQKHRDILVVTQWAHLKTGDYSLLGLEDVVAVERKSLSDLYATLSQHRDRFEAEHERMAEMPRAAVIVEASWDDIINWPPERSRLNPKTVFRTAASWYARFGVPWLTLYDRRLAEIFTYRFLEKAWKEFGCGEEKATEAKS